MNPSDVANLAFAIVGGGVAALLLLLVKPHWQRWQKESVERFEREREAEAARRASLEQAAAAEQERRANEPAPPSGPASPTQTGLLSVWGGVLLVAGLVLAFVFLFVYDTSVPAAAREVNNLGLMLNRLLGVLCGLCLFMTGALCLMADSLRSSLRGDIQTAK